MIPFRTPFACLLFALLLALSVCGPSRAEENHNDIASLEAAAARGDADAQYHLGIFYYTRQNYQKAIKWWKQAAVQGNTSAQFFLGDIYYQGRNVRQDYQKAREWWEKAAAQGDVRALAALGFLYKNGQGVRQNLATAKEYYGKACDNGFQDGCDEYRRLNTVEEWSPTLPDSG